MTGGAAGGAAGEKGSAVFTPTLGDVQSAQRLAVRGSLWRYGFGATGFGVSVALTLAADGAWSTSAIIVCTVATVAGQAAFLGLIWGLWFPRRVARHYRQQASLRQRYSVSWDAAGLLSETAQSRTLVRWSDYVKRREDAATILLYQSDLLFQFLPKRALTDAQLASLSFHLAAIPAGRRRSRRSTPRQPS